MISGYKNELRLNGKATLSAYCRSVGVSISAVHHWMEDRGLTTMEGVGDVCTDREYCYILLNSFPTKLSKV